VSTLVFAIEYACWELRCLQLRDSHRSKVVEARFSEGNVLEEHDGDWGTLQSPYRWSEIGSGPKREQARG
jgi:hypothetical protein